MRFLKIALSVSLVIGSTLTPGYAQTPSSPAEAARICKAQGKITCAEWCRRNPQRKTCMTGDPNSCDKKAQGALTCVI